MQPTPGAPTLSLPVAVGIALERNFGILSAADSATASRFRESAARAEFYPQVTPRYQKNSDESIFGADVSQKVPWTGASLAATSQFHTGSTNPPISRSSDLRVTLTQPLLRGFGPTTTTANLVASRRSRQTQERAYELARQRLAVDVAAAFYQVIRQRQLIAVAEQSAKRSENLRQASEARLQVGLASRLDVLRAELQAAQAQDAMVSARAALASALEQFRLLLGLAPQQPLEPEAVSLPDRLDAGGEPVDVLVGRALTRRLELQESRDEVTDAERNSKIANQNLLPQLDFNLQLTQINLGGSFADVFRNADRQLRFFVSTSYPVERSTEKANQAVAQLEVESRRRSLRQQELIVEADVRAAVRNLDRIRQSVELQRKAVDIAEQQHRLATLRYQRGLASNFDVVDAEGSLVAARTALVGLVTDYQVARAQLLRATGILDVAKDLGS